MSVIDRVEIPVHLAGASYRVLVGHGFLKEAGALAREISEAKNCALVTDSNVGPIYAKRVSASFEEAGFEVTAITVPAGEASKTFAAAETVCTEMADAGLDRKSLVVALGGGVVGDLAGFAAAIYYRGIPCVQIPTTIVAQVDSAVGGKTGVNLSAGKNLAGCFHQPILVLADTSTLESLPPREYREGFGEIVKHAMIRDAAMLHEIVPPLEPERLPGLIARNIAIKARIVEADEKETLDLRALLNFGHTIGHGIEAAAGYGRLLHGEAVSLGLVAAGRLSMQKAGLPEADFARMISLLEAYELPVRLPEDIPTRAILDAMARDKKFARGKIRFVLARGAGNAFVADNVTDEEIRLAVEGLRAEA